MRKISLTLALAAMAVHGMAKSHPDVASVAPDDAWRMLSQGNERFARDLVLRPHADAERRREQAREEQPYAVVVTCSDSRLAPELIFDQGLGDLFVLRTAGNVTQGDANLGSVEYAVERLGAKLVVVLGHDQCQIVKDAVNGVKKNDHSRYDELVAMLKPAADEASDKVAGLKKGEAIGEAVEKNVQLQIRNLLKGSAVVREKVEAGEIKVIGGVYSVENGRVRWLGEHPSEKAIINGKKP